MKICVGGGALLLALAPGVDWFGSPRPLVCNLEFAVAAAISAADHGAMACGAGRGC